MDLNAELVNLLNKSIITSEVFDLIQLGANPNILSDSGYSLLHILIFNRRIEDAFLLVEQYHANINIKDKNGFSPLHYMINHDYPIENIMGMVRLGAQPNNKSGVSLIHFLMTINFKYVLDLLKIHPESISLKDAHGNTPLQLMLNLRREHKFSADNFLDMVRCGADPDTVDSNGISLLRVITQFNNFIKNKELMALNKIPRQERIHYKPELLDYFICDEGIENLLYALKDEKHSGAEITYLAKYPLAKEMMIQFISTLDADIQEEMLTLSLTPNSLLNQFFSVNRSWFMTNNNRGTLAKLAQMHQQLINSKVNGSYELLDIVKEPDSSDPTEIKGINIEPDPKKTHYCTV